MINTIKRQLNGFNRLGMCSPLQTLLGLDSLQRSICHNPRVKLKGAEIVDCNQILSF